MSISGETAAGRPKKHVLRYTGVAVNRNLAETQRITKYHLLSASYYRGVECVIFKVSNIQNYWKNHAQSSLSDSGILVLAFITEDRAIVGRNKYKKVQRAI